MDHVGEVVFGHFNGEGFNLARPQRHDAISHRGQREASDAIEEAAHCEHFGPPSSAYFVTAAAMVLVVLIADCAV